jgi:ankyrin repeat protein
MLRSTQTIKLYNKIINDPLSIDGSISRTQEMNTLTHNHRLNQLIFYIHTNQKVAFINYFEQNNCKEIINHADSSGNVLLIHAIKYNQKDLFYFILENGANVNIANNPIRNPIRVL